MKPNNRKHEYRFYAVYTWDQEDWACEIEPISAKVAKRCENCGRTGGVFFKEVSPNWNLKNRLSIKTSSGPITQCYPCWLANSEGPFVRINRKGETEYPLREAIMFAASNTELAELVRRWKGGAGPNREVGTPYGAVVAHGPELQNTRPQVAKLKCPSCDAEFSLEIKASD